ncbi:MAG: glycosyltransferase family 2 protein [Ramlibacter sp.]
MHPIVSVVMPSLNQAGFIEASIRSVLDQDYPNLELLVIDGGSTDSTLQRLQYLFAEYGNRLRWVSKRDSGPANAINKALRAVRGDIVGWLNSDDLYAPGAVARAAGFFAAKPDMLMAYGEAEHIDANGKSLGRYPTQPPTATIEAFHGGCFICQPTVFVRRALFEKTSYLDEGLKTAFDFDLWLRCFRQFPTRIGHLDEVQARSRLHDGSITLLQRRHVALEGISLLAKYVGAPRPHWFWTYLDELCATYPLVGSVTDINADVTHLLEQVTPHFDSETMGALKTALAQDARLRIALPGVFADVHPDGWAGETLAVRMKRPPASGGSCLRLHCLNEPLIGTTLDLAVQTSWGEEQFLTVAPGTFEIRVGIPDVHAGDSLVVMVKTKNPFIPREVEAGSTDGRKLAFKVTSMYCGAEDEVASVSEVAESARPNENRKTWSPLSAIRRLTDAKTPRQ